MIITISPQHYIHLNVMTWCFVMTLYSVVTCLCKKKTNGFSREALLWLRRNDVSHPFYLPVSSRRCSSGPCGSSRDASGICKSATLFHSGNRWTYGILAPPHTSHTYCRFWCWIPTSTDVFQCLLFRLFLSTLPYRLNMKLFIFVWFLHC